METNHSKRRWPWNILSAISFALRWVFNLKDTQELLASLGVEVNWEAGVIPILRDWGLPIMAVLIVALAYRDKIFRGRSQEKAANYNWTLLEAMLYVYNNTDFGRSLQSNRSDQARAKERIEAELTQRASGKSPSVHVKAMKQAGASTIDVPSSVFADFGFYLVVDELADWESGNWEGIIIRPHQQREAHSLLRFRVPSDGDPGEPHCWWTPLFAESELRNQAWPAVEPAPPDDDIVHDEPI